MDTRKLDMIFFMTFENGKDLTYEEIEDIAKNILLALFGTYGSTPNAIANG